MDIPEIALTILGFLKFNQLVQCRKVNRLLQLLSDELIIQVAPLHQPHKRWLKSHLLGQKLSTTNEKWAGNQISKTFFIESFGLYVVVYSYRSPSSSLNTCQIWFRSFKNCRFMMKRETKVPFKSLNFVVKDNQLMIGNKSKIILCAIDLATLTFVNDPTIHFDFTDCTQIECIKNGKKSWFGWKNSFSIDRFRIRVNVNSTFTDIGYQQNILTLRMWGLSHKIFDISENGECFLVKFDSYLFVLIIFRHLYDNNWRLELYNLTEIYHKGIPIYNDKTKHVFFQCKLKQVSNWFPLKK